MRYRFLHYYYIATVLCINLEMNDYPLATSFQIIDCIEFVIGVWKERKRKRIIKEILPIHCMDATFAKKTLKEIVEQRIIMLQVIQDSYWTNAIK